MSHGLSFSQTPRPDRSLLADLQRHASPVTPAGTGPFPVAMLVPGCSGFDDARFAERYRAHAKRFLDAGLAIVRVDYLKARNLREACADHDGGIWEPQIAADIHRLRERLADILRVYGSRVAVIGWSMGGGGVLTALSTILDRFSRAVALYPTCRAVHGISRSIPTLFVLAALDNIQPAAACDDLVTSSGRPPAITVRRFSQAHHGFDIVTEPVIVTPRDTPTVAANHEAATQAWTEIMAFLDGI